MNVLAIGAHPLDIVFLCGGTLARYGYAGNSISLAYLCAPISESPSVSLEDAMEQRERETNQAAALIGAETHFLRISAPEFCVSRELKVRVTDLLRQVRPGLIITHDPRDYHPDHEVTSRLVHEAALLTRQYIPEAEFPLQQTSPEIIYMETVAGIGFQPEDFVDITEVIETKRNMMRCYESEIAAWENNPVVPRIEWMEITGRFRGIQSGVWYAEAFRRCHKWGHLRSDRILP